MEKPEIIWKLDLEGFCSDCQNFLYPKGRKSQLVLERRIGSVWNLCAWKRYDAFCIGHGFRVFGRISVSLLADKENELSALIESYSESFRLFVFWSSFKRYVRLCIIPVIALYVIPALDAWYFFPYWITEEDYLGKGR